MRVIIITQNDPFYLGQSTRYLIEKLPPYAQIVACVLSKATPTGKHGSRMSKARNAISIFGPSFFFRYGLYYIQSLAARSSSLKNVLKRNGIPILELKKSINSADSLARIAAYKPDLLVCIAGNQLFKKKLLTLAPHGCLNLHTALLPKYRGIMPTFWVLKNNEAETGVSVFFIDEGIDSGPILVQKRIAISPTESQRDLIIRTKKIGMDAIIEAIELIHKGNYKLIPNDEKEMSYYSFPTGKDVAEFRMMGKKFF